MHLQKSILVGVVCVLLAAMACFAAPSKSKQKSASVKKSAEPVVVADSVAAASTQNDSSVVVADSAQLVQDSIFRQSLQFVEEKETDVVADILVSENKRERVAHKTKDHLFEWKTLTLSSIVLVTGIVLACVFDSKAEQELDDFESELEVGKTSNRKAHYENAGRYQLIRTFGATLAIGGGVGAGLSFLF